jgi:hypothetical protein
MDGDHRGGSGVACDRLHFLRRVFDAIAMTDDSDECLRELRKEKRELRVAEGVDCPRCALARPKANASILLPGQTCKVDGYRDPRPRPKRVGLYK